MKSITPLVIVIAILVEKNLIASNLHHGIPIVEWIHVIHANIYIWLCTCLCTCKYSLTIHPHITSLPFKKSADGNDDPLPSVKPLTDWRSHPSHRTTCQSSQVESLDKNANQGPNNQLPSELKLREQVNISKHVLPFVFWVIWKELEWNLQP